jgi:hypothetical protein
MSAHAGGFLSPQNLEVYFKLFDKALLAVQNDPVYELRVQMALQSVRYAWLEVAKSLPYTDNWIFVKNDEGKYVASGKAIDLLDQLVNRAIDHGPALFHETSITPQEYQATMEDYFQNGVVMHKAVGKKITFVEPCSSQYTANGPSSLVDGVRGTSNYFVLWQGWYGTDVNATIDLDSLQTVSKVTVHCLSDQNSWIMTPSMVEVSGSLNGEVFTPLSVIADLNAGKKMDKSIETYELNFDTPRELRYLNLVITNIGKLPEWRGVDGRAWLFVDEIIVE